MLYNRPTFRNVGILSLATTSFLFTYICILLVKANDISQKVISAREMFGCTNAVCAIFRCMRLPRGRTNLAIRPATGLLFRS